MNYLAHFHLGYGDDGWLLGALLGDFVKGPLSGRFEAMVECGILLHRKIDAYTDTHSQLRSTQRLFDPRFRRYAGIMTDILFDHFLSLHWQRFHHLPLAEFSREIYSLLNGPSLPVKAAQCQARRLIRYDVLTGFSHWPTVETALLRVADRLGRENPLMEAAPQLQRHYVELEQVFLAFYPQLIQYSETVKQTFRTRNPSAGQ